VCQPPGGSDASTMPWFLRRGDSWYGSRTIDMRSTVSDCRQIAVSCAESPPIAGLRHASNSASTSV
jgi:hypothetical protein